MDNAYEALQWALDHEWVLDSAHGDSVLFLNARDMPFISTPGMRFSLYQYFKTHAEILQSRGYAVSPDLPPSDLTFDTAMAVLPRNNQEARFLLAAALGRLKAGGLLIVAADNKTGGGRLRKTLSELAAGEIEQLSKHKARLCRLVKTEINEQALNQALSGGAARATVGGCYSVPGIFGWDKVDRGSSLLIDEINRHGVILNGRGADFGCGYGYLSMEMLKADTYQIAEMTCIDADYRALSMCRRNTQAFAAGQGIHYFWEDLTKPGLFENAFDFIIMNPPFHADRHADTAIGKAFIEHAARALKANGTLYMVGNVLLPYETVLQSAFSTCRKLAETGGFKVFEARR